MSLAALLLATSLTANPLPILKPDISNHVHSGQCLLAPPEHFNGLGFSEQDLMQRTMSMGGGGHNAEIDENGFVVLDLAVWYSPVWAQIIGDQEVDRRVALWVETTNRVFSNSGVKARVNLLFAREMAYEFCEREDDPWVLDQRKDENGYCLLGEPNGTLRPNTGGLPYSIGRMWGHTSPNGGSDSTLPKDYPMFHHTSAEYGADLHLWIQEAYDNDILNGPLGMASTFGESASAVDQSTAPAYHPDVSDLYENAIIATGHTIAHEIGHNLGLQHEFDGNYFESAGVKPDSFAYACGQGTVPGTATTIMWSVGNPRYIQREIFSSPDIFVHDEACGTYERENQVLAANRQAPLSASIGVRPASRGTVRFSQETYTAPNGRDMLMVTLTRDGDLSQPAEVEVTAVDGTALHGEHYTGLKQVVQFQAGQQEALARFDVMPVGGNTLTFDLKLQYPLRLTIDTPYALAVLEGSRNTAAKGTFSVTPALMLAEHTKDYLRIERAGEPVGEAVFNVTSVDGTARANVHYQAIQTQVRFVDGQSEVLVPVQTFITDSVREFSVMLEPMTPSALLQGTAQITVLPGERGLVYFKTDGEGVFNGDFADRNYNWTEDCIHRAYPNPSQETCIYHSVEDKPDSTAIPVKLERLYGSSGPTSVTIAVYTGETAGGNYYWKAPEGKVVNPTRTIFFEDGQTEVETVFYLKDVPESIVKTYPLRGVLILEIIDDNRDLAFQMHPVRTHILFNPLAEPKEDGNTDGSTGDGNTDGGNTGDNNPNPTPEPEPEAKKTKGGSTDLISLLILGVLGFIIRRKALSVNNK